jgi:hypothetical protein
LKPGDLIGVNKDSYLVLDTLPAEYDSRVKAMEVDEKPTEKYSDVGGLHKQIEELVEAVVWPMQQADRFKKIGIKAPKGRSFETIIVKHTDTNAMFRSPNVWTPWYWKDPSRSCLCRSNRCYIP